MAGRDPQLRRDALTRARLARRLPAPAPRVVMRAAPASPALASSTTTGLLALEQACNTLFQLGFAHHSDGRLEQAAIAYRAVLDVRPDHADSLHLLGVVAYQSGRSEEAIDLIGQALRLKDDRADYANNLGNALQRAARLADAETCYRAAITLDPQSASAHNNLGAVLRELGRPQEAVGVCRAALRLRPDYADAENNLAIALADIGDFEGAAESCYAALKLQENRLETLNNLGNILAFLGRHDEAIVQYRAALAVSPDSADIHHNLGMTLLGAGQFEEGWREYEWRWETRQLKRAQREFTQPQWDGAPLAGRTLLIHAEQGFGDTLQFCRYATRIEGRVIIEVQPALVGLLKGQLAGHDIIGHDEALPDFDVHCPMLTLPSRIEPTPDPAANAAAYLRADPDRVAVWRKRIAGAPGLRVGLVWAGGARPDQPCLASINRRRSTALEVLAPLADVDGVSLFSLQKGPPALEAAQPPAGMQLHDLTAHLTDFAETAALIEALDVVISVDTAVAHLAGALGKPVWLLNRFDSCWRWRADRTDSDYYPTMKQFRQLKSGDWNAPVVAMAAELTDWAGHEAEASKA